MVAKVLARGAAECVDGYGYRRKAHLQSPDVAVRKPAKMCRLMGWSQFRKVFRATCGRVAHEAPRSTL